MGCFQSSEQTSFGSANTFDRQKKSKKSKGNEEDIEESKCDLLSRYKISKKVLGSGGFGRVFKAISCADPSLKFAIKVINKKANNIRLEEIEEEIRILRELDHPNIVKYFETFEDVNYVFIVTELCSKGDMYDLIKKKVETEGCFTELEAASMMKTLLKAVNHCHSMGIAHRDIKPENIMIGDDGNLKLIDFGLSKQVEGGENIFGAVGSAYYVAPEVLKGSYSVKCDIWSLGVILYVLLSGYTPFQGEKTKEILTNVKKCKPSYSHEEFKSVSEDGMDLVKHMLDGDPKTRYSATDCLNHNWFKMNQVSVKDPNKESLNPNILKNILKYKSVSVLRRKAMNVLVKMLNSREITEIRKQFEKIDTDNSGSIEAAELTQALERVGFSITAENINKIFEEVDIDKNQKINYTEFIAATLNVREFLTDSKLYYLFRLFDVDQSGYITLENLNDAFSKMDAIEKQKQESFCKRTDIINILEKHDTLKDGKISFEEFKEMMLAQDDSVIEAAVNNDN